MSPSENELRAALSDGEGPRLDVNAIIGNAVAFQRQRRARVLGGVSVTAIVAGLGVASGLLINSSDNGSSASSADKGAAVHGAGSASAPAAESVGQGAGGAGGGAAFAADCPASLPSVSAPKSASAASLFPADVRSVVVCSYGSAQQPAALHATPTSTSISGDQATSLLDSINGAAQTRGGVCPDFRTTRQPQHYVFFGVNDSGAKSSPVVATVGDNPCQTVITNGKAVRYAWSPPNGLASILAGLNSGTSVAPPPSIGPSGVPIPSQSHS